MVSPALPQRRSPLSSSSLRPPPRPGGPACRSLARSAAGDGWDAPHETPGLPLPLPGEAPSPLGLCRPAAAYSSPASSCSSSHHHPSWPHRWVQEPSPPGAAPERGGFAGPRCPHPGRQSHGAEARGLAPSIPPPPRFSPFICFISFFFLFFFFFLLFLPRSPFLSFPFASEGGGRQRDYFFPRRRDLGAPPSGGDAQTNRRRIAIGSGGGGGIRGARREVRRPGGLAAR